MSTCLGGSSKGVCVNSFGWVVRARSFEGRSFDGNSINSFGRGCARIKNAKLLPEVGFVHVRVARFPCSPLSLCFDCAGAYVKSFGRVV